MVRRTVALLIVSLTLVACSSAPDWRTSERSSGATYHGSPSNGSTGPLTDAQPEVEPEPSAAPDGTPIPIPSPDPTEAPSREPSPPTETQPPAEIEPTPADPAPTTEGTFESNATEAQPAVFTTPSGPAGPDATTANQYIEAVITHADTIWTNWFLANGLREPLVGYEIVQPGYQFASACGLVVASNHPNAYYCDKDINTFGEYGMIILPLETMMKMWTGDVLGQQVTELNRIGDFAAAMLIAHEFGHHIAAELARQEQVKLPALGEHIADCFAGVWTYSVYLDGYLEEGDIDEALAAVAVIGDYRTDTSHGTPDERKNAFMIGLYGSQANPVGGVPANCIDAFWG